MSIDLDRVFALIDAANREDPAHELVDGAPQPKEWLYGVRMSERLTAFRPDASMALQIACRAQHLARFKVPRSDYPDGREGYLRWRSDHARKHAEGLTQILTQCGAEQELIDRCAFLVQKKRLRQDAETQALEDVACLVFLEHYALEFAGQHPEPKVIDIVQKTWGKMSEGGHAAALQLILHPAVAAVVKKALA
ncbi:MAG: DUF4202 domain-containing protein [Polyangiales bacterium]|nr:DUF4202 domain-containing protein [Myxococcales bacterium]MCB9661087.1 DUF4202 domain-containing protein [Sandaracinaceae bacterium]